MVLLPASVTAREAVDTRRLLTQAVGSEAGASVAVDASRLTQFDSAALAVLLACQRAADAAGKTFAVQNPPRKLAALAKLYGVDVLLLMPAATASGEVATPAA